MPQDSYPDRSQEFEGQIVQVLYRRYNTPREVRNRIWQTLEDETGQGHHTLDGWYREYPTFPIYLGAAVISHLPKTCTLSKLFLDFGGRPFIRAREEVIQSAPEEVGKGKPCGLVVRWPYLSGSGDSPTGLVIHDRGWSSNVSGVRISWTMPGSKEETLCVEHLTTMLDGIDNDAPGRKWEPESDG